MTITTIPGRDGSAYPSFEDAARAAYSRRRLASMLASSLPLTMTFVVKNKGKDRTEHISLPPLAVRALHQILAHLSAGRGVSLMPLETEMDLSDAALLLGLDELDLIDTLTGLGSDLHIADKTPRLGTKTVAQCFAVIHGDCPDELVDPKEFPEIAAEKWTQWAKAKTMLTRGQKDFVPRLSRDLKSAGNGFFADLAVLDYYFGTRPISGNRPRAWPPVSINKP